MTKQNDAIEDFKEKQCLFIGAKYVQFTHEEADKIRIELERAQRMEKALEFYANHNENWRKDIDTGQSNIVNDQGRIALQALSDMGIPISIKPQGVDVDFLKGELTADALMLISSQEKTIPHDIVCMVLDTLMKRGHLTHVEGLESEETIKPQYRGNE